MVVGGGHVSGGDVGLYFLMFSCFRMFQIDGFGFLLRQMDTPLVVLIMC